MRVLQEIILKKPDEFSTADGTRLNCAKDTAVATLHLQYCLIVSLETRTIQALSEKQKSFQE